MRDAADFSRSTCYVRSVHFAHLPYPAFSLEPGVMHLLSNLLILTYVDGTGSSVVTDLPNSSFNALVA